MIRLRLPLLFLVALFCVCDVSAALLRFRGFPTRQRIVRIAIPTPAPEPVAKLPPPVAPGMDKNQSLSLPATLPSDVEIEKNSAAAPTVTESKPEEDPDAGLKARIKAERARLNRNAFLWQQERAAGGSATAQRSLAVRYLTGDGVERDEIMGMDLLRKAAAGGDSAARKELAKREREPAKKE